MAGPEPSPPVNKRRNEETPNQRTPNQNTADKSIIEGHLTTLRELLKEPSNWELIKPMLLDFSDDTQDTDEEVKEIVKKNKERTDKANPKDKGKVVVADEDL
ncbi:hypothetical protein Tco_0380843, partial [Tanacetum coccineum]